MKNNFGTCHICGKYAKLTSEHLPPKSTGNNKLIHYYSYDQIFSPDHLSGMKRLSEFPTHRLQGGFRMNTLCESCNKFTGFNYVPAYSDFSNRITNAMNCMTTAPQLGDTLHFQAKITPLNFFKQVLSIFCSILDPATVALYGFKDFILTRNSSALPEKPFSLHMYLIPINGASKNLPAAGLLSPKSKKQMLFSEFASPPFGFILNLTPQDACISFPNLLEFVNFKFNESATLEFNLPLLNPRVMPLSFEGWEDKPVFQ